MERLPRRQGHSSSAAATSLANNNIVGSGVPIQAGTSSSLLNIQVVDSNSNQSQSARNSSSQFLIKYVILTFCEYLLLIIIVLKL